MPNSGNTRHHCFTECDAASCAAPSCVAYLVWFTQLQQAAATGPPWCDGAVLSDRFAASLGYGAERSTQGLGRRGKATRFRLFDRADPACDCLHSWRSRLSRHALLPSRDSRRVELELDVVRAFLAAVWGRIVRGKTTASNYFPRLHCTRAAIVRVRGSQGLLDAETRRSSRHCTPATWGTSLSWNDQKRFGSAFWERARRWFEVVCAPRGCAAQVGVAGGALQSARTA